ncbi:MAG: undecaprenyl-diphosphatase [Rhodospirillaceae bacterium]|nr:MAG: undecaprenyl-diphosphatase [Rhodospirillaceae bacterium]
MDVILLQAILLGVVEGLTEFLPVSSTGHLLLLGELLGFQGPPGKAFEIVIQLGAILAVCWVYRMKLASVAFGLFRDHVAMAFTRNVLLGFLPAMVVGFFAYGFIKNVLFNLWVVAAMLVAGGLAILVIERWAPPSRYRDTVALSAHVSLRIGLFQCIAMIPGVSRSGATIMGSLLMRVDRRAATEFSFFVAIPTMLAATVYDLYKSRDMLSMDNGLLIIAGFASAFLVALLVVRTAIAFISNHGFTPFAFYRILLGSIALIVLALR